MQGSIIVLAIQILIGYVKNIPVNVDSQLLEKLFKNHTAISRVRPVNTSKDKVEVQMGIELLQLVTVDERQQYIKTNVWFRQMWKNKHLQWNPKEWGGIDQLYTEPGFIWCPDIVLYNDASENFAGGLEKFKTLITMHPSGLNVWLAPASYKSTCKMNVKYFPFDTQVCILKFGSWAFDANRLRLRLHDVPLITEKYVNSSIWDVIAYKSDFNSIIYQCCPEPFHDITFTFVLKRRPMYYIVNLVPPCVVLTLIVLFSFVLPADSRNRLAINITILLAMTVFLNLLGDMLPQTSDSTPILSVFFISMIGMIGFTLITMIIVHTIYLNCLRKKHEETNPPPRWTLKLIVNCIGKFIGFESQILYQNGYKTSDEEQGLLVGIDEHFSPRGVKLSEIFERRKRKKMCKTLRKKEVDEILIRYSQDILNELTKISKTKIKADDQKIAEDEWLMIANVIDRLCFIICLTMFFVSASTTSILMYQQKPVDINLV